MMSRLIRKIPNRWLVWMYVRFPIKGVKDWLVYRSQSKFLMAVLAVVTNEAGEVLLLKHTYRKDPWGIPGGWMQHESPGEALEREIFEETSFKVKVEGAAKPVYATKPHRIELLYRAKWVSGTFRQNEEISAYQFCKIGEWPEGLPESQIQLIKTALEE
ncbi:NUDIX hydrolase [Paenibacillus physcomitrellae]|uniref:NUDIX hydrolase n=1 Tax=Paenibacillus physcomitrellae TaxID=1619311 RepID=A0ABQ1GK00_9BACL|nr:NUDIX domain-containing protein [Paenibacillus physcomitrellae]GGA45145.1 NUDIX hydrolase [Paenibacillus physcomitrellae]